MLLELSVTRGFPVGAMDLTSRIVQLARRMKAVLKKSVDKINV